ncbi:MAG: transposase [Motiliproteus sp.]
MELISPQFVKPFVKTNKNDANDAQAIVGAASRPSMNFVPIKQVEQQDIQSIHRIRTRIVKNRTALINEIRGLCLEYGIVIAPEAARVKPSLCAVITESDNELTPLSRECMSELYDELTDIESRLRKLDTKISQLCRLNENCQRILKTPRCWRTNRHGDCSSRAQPKRVPQWSSYVGLVRTGSTAIVERRQTGSLRYQ